jgi:hypothetical protein
MAEQKIIYKEDINKDGFISKIEALPYWIDKLRLFPRAFITVYIYMFYNVVDWFMQIQEPNMAQAGLVSVVTGAGAAWFGLYVNSGSGNADKIVVQTDTSSIGTKGSFSGTASSDDKHDLGSSNPYR